MFEKEKSDKNFIVEQCKQQSCFNISFLIFVNLTINLKNNHFSNTKYYLIVKIKALNTTYNERERYMYGFFNQNSVLTKYSIEKKTPPIPLHSPARGVTEFLS